MSLHQLAHHLSAQGRNGDTTLVHMTQKEVSDLQELAHKHGTSLTINPHTGLPEASLLGDIIHEGKNAVKTVAKPIADLGAQGGGIGNLLIGAALAAYGLPPEIAGYIMGGSTAVSTGSLSKGLAAGLGAYGGGNIYNGVAGAGGVGGSAMTEQSKAGLQAAQQRGIEAGISTAADQSAAETARLAAANTAAAPTSEVAKASYEVLKDNPKALYDNIGLKSAAAAAAPLILSTVPKTAMPTDNTPTTNPADESSYIRPYYYDPVTHSAVALAPVATKSWKNATLEGRTPYTPVNAATGGLMALASGGTPDQTDLVTPITTTTNIPGAPAGGFTNMQSLRNTYTAGGGKDPVAVAPTQTYSNTDTSSQAYNYLAGKRSYPVQNTGIDYNTRYYWGIDPASQQTQAQFENRTWLNPATGTVQNNPYYALDKTITPTGDPGTGMKWAWDATQLRWLPVKKAAGGLTALAAGGTYNLGDYSDGGRLLKGPGDGVSDSIPAEIGGKQPARLADGEFVVPARIVSELGNGSTDAGARKLYQMMDRVQNARKKTTGKDRVAKNTNASAYLPA